ncbi:MAG TPA: YbaB/EbfC family nucleoid-associated protein, partial [Clostridia bacterium]|nr:YbaB/EbfC family nucleoid-associated protein [Clostridia bacterium]
MNPKQLQDMMQRAQEMQRQMQQKMQDLKVEASAGGGAVTVKMN